VKLLGARIRGNLSFSHLTDNRYWNAGHGLSRAWGPFSAEENFSTGPSDETLSHQVRFELKAPVKSHFDGDILLENKKLNREWTTSLGLDPGRRIPLGFSLAADALWTEDFREEAELLRNYAVTWAKSWEPLIPDLGEGAQKRNIHGLVTVPLKTMPMGVELSADGLSEFSGQNNTTRSETLGRIDIPLVFNEYRILLRGERNFRRSLFYAGSDALDDGFRYYESISDSLPLWYSAPLYSLFAPGLAQTMSSALENAPAADITEYGHFKDSMTLALQMPIRSGLPSLMIPHTVETKLARDLEQKFDTRLDVFTITSELRFSAINTFGAFGVIPLFKFYQSDEISHDLETTIAIPREDALSWRFMDEENFKFYGFLGAELSLTNTLTLGSSGWAESLAADWIVPVKKSLLGSVYDWLSGLVRGRSAWPALSALASTEYERLRKETLEFTITSVKSTAQKESLRSSINLGHESIIRILGRLYLSTFIKLNCEQDYNNRQFSFIGSLGTTLNIMF
jgi:hypothetical protein